MKKLLLVLTMLGCGSTTQNLSVTSILLVDEQTSVQALMFDAISFTIDTNVMTDPALLVSIAATAPINLVVMDAANFAIFQDGGSATGRFDSGPTTGTDIDLPMPDSGTFHLILANRAGETAVLVTIRGEIFWQE